MAIKKQKTTADTTPAEGARIFDVARPGQMAPADATARPVIVTNRVVMQDPMMTTKPSVDPLLPADDDQASQKAPQKIVIRPLSGDTSGETGSSVAKPSPMAGSHDDDADGVLEPPTETAAAAAPTGFPMPVAAGDTKPKTDSQSSEPDQSAPAEATTTSSTASSATASSSSSDSGISEGIDGLDDQKAAAKLEADAKSQDELDSLVEDKTYFLPINSVVQRRSRHVFIFGTILILFLAVAWLDIALDAGFVSIPGVQPLTHLFSN